MVHVFLQAPILLVGQWNSKIWTHHFCNLLEFYKALTKVLCSVSCLNEQLFSDCNPLPTFWALTDSREPLSYLCRFSICTLVNNHVEKIIGVSSFHWCRIQVFIVTILFYNKNPIICLFHICRTQFFSRIGMLLIRYWKMNLYWVAVISPSNANYCSQKAVTKQPIKFLECNQIHCSLFWS